jgi:hypothetical protein
VDVLYVQTGSIQKDFTNPGKWAIYGGLPAHLPDANEYWLVFRSERQGFPDASVASLITESVARQLEIARQRHLNVVGIQLDIDCPTAMLASYGRFIRELRTALPKNLQISVTALLDWFRSETDAADLIKETDEFVPQFYDTGTARDILGGAAIAQKIDAAVWGPKLNRFGKRYRIGVSTFGRARLVKNPPPGWNGDPVFTDLGPLTVATSPAFKLTPARNAANELVLTYRAVRKTSIYYHNFDPVDALQFILSTPEEVRDAVENARKLGPQCAGVLFFRWPQSNEALTLMPEEALAAAGLPAGSNRAPSVTTYAGSCAVVSCVDVYLQGSQALPTGTRYRIHSSVELEYFLPEENMPVRMAGPSDLEVNLPPYCGRGSLPLGRAVTARPASFTVEQKP